MISKFTNTTGQLMRALLLGTIGGCLSGVVQYLQLNRQSTFR